jgi:hypothetical protein
MTRVWPLHGIFLHLGANGLLSNLRKCPIWSKRTLRIGLTSVRVLEFDGVGVVGELAGFDDRCDNGRPCFFPCIMLAFIRPSATYPLKPRRSNTSRFGIFKSAALALYSSHELVQAISTACVNILRVHLRDLMKVRYSVIKKSNLSTPPMQWL